MFLKEAFLKTCKSPLLMIPVKFPNCSRRLL